MTARPLSQAPRAAWLLLGLLTQLATGCRTAPIEAQPWLEVRTASFRFLSQVDEARTVRMAQDLELFQTVLSKLVTETDFAPPIPTTVVLFRDQRSYGAFAPSSPRGLFVPQQRANYAVANAESDLVNENSALLHEYVHYVVHNSDAFVYPAWYDEGLAHLYGQARIGSEKVELGILVPEFLTQLEQLPPLRLEELANVRNPVLLRGTQGAAFDARAWIFVHYLEYGSKVGFPDRSEQLYRYFERVSAGAEPAQACIDAFGVDFAALEAEVSAYVEKGMLPARRLERGAFPEPAPPLVRRLDGAEAARELGLLSLALGDPAHAEALFRSALALRPDDARAQFGLARAFGAQRRDQELAPFYARALKLGPDDALNELDYARSLLVRASTASEPVPLLAEARVHLRRAIELDPLLPEAHAQLAGSYLLFQGEDATLALPSALRAHELLSSDGEIGYLAAMALIEVGRLEEAQGVVAAARVQVQSTGTLERLDQLAELIARVREAERSTVADRVPPTPAGPHP